MTLLPVVRQALCAPSTPRANKRRCLERHSSDEKENMPLEMCTKLVVDPNRPNVYEKENQPLAALSINCVAIAEEKSCPSALSIAQLQAQDRFSEALQKQTEVYPLVGREQECGKLDSFLQHSLGHGPGNGKSLYISGGPGTGKTCSVRACINKWKRSEPDTLVLDVNCMDLTQRSVPGVLQRLLERMGCARTTGRSMQGLAGVAATNLGQKAARVVIVVDEVDQLVGRGNGRAASGALSLETLFSLPLLPGAPAVAIIAIANAVDLLERTAFGLNCGTLLFEAYDKDQLKNIVTSRVKAVEGGEAALKALGPVKVELRVRKVAKECGDCRQVLSLIEEALFEARSISVIAPTEPCGEADPHALLVAKREARPLMQSNRNDPLQAIAKLPLEQKILLSALATSKQEATKVSDVCSKYKELCRALHQPDNLGTKGQVNSALSALEQRGLLELRVPRGGAARARGKAMLAETTVELSVSCAALCENVVRALLGEGFSESVVKALGLRG